MRTRNDLDETVREKICQLLEPGLADSIDLALQAKHAHWNVKGPQFFMLHELFDQIAATVSAQTDTLAERIVALGGMADGRLEVVSRKRNTPDFPDLEPSGKLFVSAISDAAGAYVKGIRAGIDQATRLGDAVTADLLTEITGEMDKQLWFLESHLQGTD